LYSFHKSGNIDYCPHCRADKRSKTDEERVKELKKRVKVNDSGAMYILGNSYGRGFLGLPQDHAKGIELLAKAAGLGSSEAHFELGVHFDEAGDSKKERFHYEAAAMAGHENARVNLGLMELQSGNTERAVKHWMIAASAGSFRAMHNLRTAFEDGLVSRDTIEPTLTAYNNSCVEMRSKARDAAIQLEVDTNYTINIA
jgi:TPR repeat protein